MDRPVYNRNDKNYDSRELWSPEWRALRKRVIEAQGGKCFRCKYPHKKINVHHLQYEEGKRAWEYSDDKFILLCQTCHSKEHIISEVIFFMIELSLENNMIITMDMRKKAAEHFGISMGSVISKMAVCEGAGVLYKRNEDKKNITHEVEPSYTEYYPYYDIFNPPVYEYTDEIDYIIVSDGIIEAGMSLPLRYKITKEDLFIDENGEPALKINDTLKIGGAVVFKRKQ